MHEAMSVRLRAGRAEDIPALSEEIVRWTLLFHTSAIGQSVRAPGGAGAGELDAAHARAQPGRTRTSAGPTPARPWTRGCRRACAPSPPDDPQFPRAPESEERAPRAPAVSVLNLAVVDDYHELSAPQIAEEAGVPIESFFDLFASKEECFLAAFDDLGDELLADRRRPRARLRRLAPRGSPRRRRAVEACSPTARCTPDIIASEAPSACPEALERDCELTHGIATLLTEGAPEPARNKLAVEGVAGAIWHTIRCQVVSRQIHPAARAVGLSGLHRAHAVHRRGDRRGGRDRGRRGACGRRAYPPVSRQVRESGIAPPADRAGADRPVSVPSQIRWRFPASARACARRDGPRTTGTQTAAIERQITTIHSANTHRISDSDLAPFARAAIDEVRQHDPEQHRDHDHDDQRRCHRCRRSS